MLIMDETTFITDLSTGKNVFHVDIKTNFQIDRIFDCFFQLPNAKATNQNKRLSFIVVIVALNMKSLKFRIFIFKFSFLFEC